MNEVVISLGSNTDDRTRQIRVAIERLSAMLSGVVVSTVYETEAFSHPEQRPYANAVLKGMSDLGHDELSKQLKQLEANAGRDATARAAGLVPIDLDIVLWDRQVERPSDFTRPYFTIGFQQL